MKNYFRPVDMNDGEDFLEYYKRLAEGYHLYRYLTTSRDNGKNMLIDEYLYKQSIKKVYINEKKRAVTVIWNDGTVKVSYCHPKDEFDASIGIAMCIAQKTFGSRNALRRVAEYAERIGE